ncbi:MAG: DUF4863 family protein [Deltaproteobacteria bacterium]|nr:DUF4863 family protein [Deltaproteobacteria bacterium]
MTATLLDLLQPILARLAELDLPSRTTEEQVRELEALLEQDFPYAGDRVQAIGRELARGVEEGWLCDRGEPQSRFSRVAKPSPASSGFSIDVVSMVGPALEHTHLRGEVTLGFPAKAGMGTCQFEGRPPGWIFLPPGSRHVPTVDGERMNLVYFLPDGAVQWHPPA